MRSRQYGRDVLAPENRKPKPGQGPVPQVEAERDLVVEDFEGRFCGAVVAVEPGAVTLEDRLRQAAGVPAARHVPARRQAGHAGPAVAEAARTPANVGRRTASGSVAAPQQRAKVAKASRIYVEGKHDAELVEKIWGDDLRDVGVVVEYLEGVDDLAAIVRDFEPDDGRRLGVLVDHLVAGSKESRIAAAVGDDPNVLVVGHPFIDIWAAVKPGAARADGLARRAAGAVVEGRRAARGSAGRTRRRRTSRPRGAASCARSSSYADLEPELLGRVEELIDFVTAPDEARLTSPRGTTSGRGSPRRRGGGPARVSTSLPAA